MASQELTPRDQTQLSVFTRWINHHGEKAREPINCKNMATDLTSGEIMVLLSEVFVPGPNTKYAKAPKNQLQRTQNQSHALTRFETVAEIVNIHPSTLADEEKDNLRVWMGYIFQLILTFTVSEQVSADCPGTPAEGKKKGLAELKADLIDWVNTKLATLTPQERSQAREFNKLTPSEDEMVVKNLEKDWQDGSHLTGLCLALHPTDKRAKGMKKLEKNAAKEKGEHAPLAAVIHRSDKNLTVPPLMKAEELAKHPDQNAILTYVSEFKNAVYVDDSEACGHKDGNHHGESCGEDCEGDCSDDCADDAGDGKGKKGKNAKNKKGGKGKAGDDDGDKATLDWDEPTFLRIEVKALQAADWDTITEQHDKIVADLEEYNTNKENGVEYDASSDRKAIRMAIHLERVIATLKNEFGGDGTNTKGPNSDSKAHKKSKSDLIDDLGKSEKEVAKLQKRQSKLEELQRALLVCAEISDHMSLDELE